MGAGCGCEEKGGGEGGWNGTERNDMKSACACVGQEDKGWSDRLKRGWGSIAQSVKAMYCKYIPP